MAKSKRKRQLELKNQKEAQRILKIVVITTVVLLVLLFVFFMT